MPCWLGYLPVYVAATFFGVFLMPSFRQGPFSWAGLINFYIGLGAFFVWMLIVTAYALRAIETLQREDSAAVVPVEASLG